MSALSLLSASRPATLTAALARPAATSLPARLADTLRVLYRINAPLAVAGWLHLGLAAVLLVALPLDHRLVTGAPVWLKPLKFALSGVVFTWSLAWMLADLPAAQQRAVRRIGVGVALGMVVETGIIAVQAARGVSSHYNQSSALNGILFGIMGVFVLLITLLMAWALYLAWRHQPHGSAGYVWGLRLGLLVFLVGSAVGGYMIQHLGHTVGAADGGPGLLGLGWSTRAGDVRIAHFMGLHALQVLPLLGWGLGRVVPRRAAALTGLGAGLYVLAMAALLGQALAGQPLWAGR